MQSVAVFILGIVIGAGIIFLFNWVLNRNVKSVADDLILQNEQNKEKETSALMERIKESFGNLSFEALSKNTEEFLKLADVTLVKHTKIGEKELEGKKKLIDQTLNEMKMNLDDVQQLVVDFEKDREKKFGELTSQLKLAAEQTGKLQETTNKLQGALASTKVRGQWGERMAEDVLRLAGFIEGVNYLKQKSLDRTGTRPDYTFLLPQNLKLNMDVKFPLDNYLKYLNEDGEMEKTKYKKQFLRDVSNRIKEVTTRDYINPSERTIDYVIVFIPNEQVYSFVNQSDRLIIDKALKNKVVLCSPITLYAILAIIRQAIDSFRLEKTASEILSLFGAFKKQWDMFKQSFEKMGKKIEEAQDEYSSLTSTRRNQLERPLRKIEDLRKQRGIK